MKTKVVGRLVLRPKITFDVFWTSFWGERARERRSLFRFMPGKIGLGALRSRLAAIGNCELVAQWRVREKCAARLQKSFKSHTKTERQIQLTLFYQRLKCLSHVCVTSLTTSAVEEADGEGLCYHLLIALRPCQPFWNWKKVWRDHTCAVVSWKLTFRQKIEL